MLEGVVRMYNKGWATEKGVCKPLPLSGLEHSRVGRKDVLPGKPKPRSVLYCALDSTADMRIPKQCPLSTEWSIESVPTRKVPISLGRGEGRPMSLSMPKGLKPRNTVEVIIQII